MRLPLLTGLGLLFSAGCAVSTGPHPADPMRRAIERQANSWNEGDIHGFMKYYWNSEALTFSSGGETRQGWQATLERYLTRYPDKATMGTLDFQVDEVVMLGDDAAFMLGRWHLTRDEPIGGNFSLVWQRKPEGWRIVHDHTSVKEDD